MKQFVDNIQKIKEVIKGWDQVYNAKSQVELKEVEEGIRNFFEENSFNTFSQEDLETLKVLKGKRRGLLETDEIAWRLKSRPIWLKEGVNNTKLFHKYESYRK